MPARTSSPLLLPRGLIFVASLWLIGSWLITIGLRTPIQPVSASYTPLVRMMIMCMVVGLMIGWPLLRLSQRTTAHAIAHTMLDMCVLLSLTQVVIWPLRLVTPWSISRTAAIDATLSCWVLIAGAVVASAIGTDRSGVRTLAMIAVLGMCLLGPTLAAIGAASGVDAMELIDLGPLLAVNTLGEGGGAQPTAAQWRWISLLATCAALAWTVLLAYAALARRKG